jgi:DMSO/TMAO reductase YedYZ heme-binding membrane subunit
MIILGITSNTLSVIKLKKNWKKLQYLTYPTFAIICIHKAIAEDEIKPYIVLLVYTILKIIEIKKNKKLLSPSN